MVNFNSDTLDRTFAALADGTRRAILARLADRGEMTVSALARPFALSLPAVMKHLSVLADAGLVVREKRGRSVHCRLDAAPLHDANAWLAHCEGFWSERLDALGDYLEGDPCPHDPQPPRTPNSSSSSATSASRRSASGTRGPRARR